MFLNIFWPGVFVVVYKQGSNELSQSLVAGVKVVTIIAVFKILLTALMNIYALAYDREDILFLDTVKRAKKYSTYFLVAANSLFYFLIVKSITGGTFSAAITNPILTMMIFVIISLAIERSFTVLWNDYKLYLYEH